MRGDSRDVACNVFHNFLTTVNKLQKCEPHRGGIMVERNDLMRTVRADLSKKEKLLASDGRTHKLSVKS